MRILGLLAAAGLVAAPVAAQAAEPPCLSAPEFTALASYALPSIITGTTERCNGALPASAWLPRNGGQLAARYAVGKAAAWPNAKNAFLKLSSSGTNAEAANLLKNLPDTSLQPMFDALIAGMIGQQLPTERCGMVDRVVRLLAPLPPENTAELIAVLVGIGSRTGQAKVGSFSLCQA